MDSAERPGPDTLSPGVARRTKASADGGPLRDIGMLGAKRALSAMAERRCSRNELRLLDVDQETIRERLQHRSAHFFPKELMESQFAALEKEVLQVW